MTRSQALAWLRRFVELCRVNPLKAQIILCPPFPLLESLRAFCHAPIALGAQDCHAEKAGAYTGDTSPALISELGCRYVIVGHSERRQAHHETNHDIVQKAHAAQQHNMCPIICIGEGQEQRGQENARAWLCQQCLESTENLKQPYMIAYEPLWAIGSGETPTPDDIERISSHLHAALKTKDIPILYGGSVDSHNARHFLASGNLRGLLVGGKSLQAETFYQIANSKT